MDNQLIKDSDVLGKWMRSIPIKIQDVMISLMFYCDNLCVRTAQIKI